MRDDAHGPYIIISPVKDEAAHIRQTIGSVLSQRVRPVHWLIVDDGSADGTDAIVRRETKGIDWIGLLKTGRREPRNTGAAEVAAFMAGYHFLAGQDFDYIVKLDGDLSFAPDYFQILLERFASNPALGIASGCYLEAGPTGWKPVAMPEYHAAGASKVVRRQCFQDIGGFIQRRGWDTVDEIRAWRHGWETCHFPDLAFLHLRGEGTGMGTIRTALMHGEIYCNTGGSPGFFLLKTLRRCLFGRPLLLNGAALFLGYCRMVLRGRELLVTEEEAACYRRRLNARLLGPFSSSLLKPMKSKGH